MNRDKNTTLEEMRKLVRKTAGDRGWDPDARSIAISVVLEAAELLEHFQWGNEVMNDRKREEIELEIADVLFYVCELADKLELDIAEAMRKKIEKINEKYPADKIKELGDEFYYRQKKKYRTG